MFLLMTPVELILFYLQDEEEFPDLSLASVNPSKAQRHLSIPGIQVILLE